MTASIAIGTTAGTGFAAPSFRYEPLFVAGAFGMLALMPPTLTAMALDQRTLLGVNVWIKPFKFELALAVFLATLAWFAGFLPPGVAARRSFRVFAGAVVLASVAEMAWIGGAAMFGEASHFNTSSFFLQAVYPVMGLLATLISSAALVYGVLILRHRASRLDPALRLALGLGLVLNFVLTLVVAGYMSSQPGHLVRAATASDAAGLSFFGWARDAGDLRVAHFFATHAMHVIPAFGLVAGRALPSGAGRLGVALFSVVYAAFVLRVFAAAIMGQPFAPP